MSQTVWGMSLNRNSQMHWLFYWVDKNKIVFISMCSPLLSLALFMFSATVFFSSLLFFPNEIAVHRRTHAHTVRVLWKRDSWTRNHQCNKGSSFAHLIVCIRKRTTASAHSLQNSYIRKRKTSDERSNRRSLCMYVYIGAANNNDSLSHLPQLLLLLLVVVVVLMLFSVSFLPLSQSHRIVIFMLK